MSVRYNKELGAFCVDYGFCTAILFLGDWFTSKEIKTREFYKNDVIIFDADSHDCADSVRQRLFGESSGILIKYQAVEDGYHFPEGALTIKTSLSVEEACKKLWKITGKGEYKCRVIDLKQ